MYGQAGFGNAGGIDETEHGSVPDGNLTLYADHPAVTSSRLKRVVRHRLQSSAIFKRHQSLFDCPKRVVIAERRRLERRLILRERFIQLP